MTLLDEEYDYEMEHIYVKRESFTFHALNNFVLYWHEYGFSLMFQSLHLPGLPDIEARESNIVLTTNMLSAGFYIYR